MSEPSKKFIRAFGFVLCLALAAQAQAGGQTADPLLAKLDCPDRVQDVAFSPDGRLLAAGYGWNEGGVRIWTLADRKAVADLAVGKKSANVSHVEFSPDGKLLAAANWDGDVALWEVGSWDSHKTVLSKRGKPEALAFSPSGTKLAFSSEKLALLYDLRSGTAATLSVGNHPQDSLISVSFTPDGRTVLVFRDSGVEVRDAEAGKLVTNWKQDGGGFFGGVSPDGRFVIAGGGAIYGEKSLAILDARDGRKLRELTAFRSGLFAFAVSHSAKLFALAGGHYGGGGDLSLWSLEEAKELGFVSFGRMPIDALAFSPDDSILAAGSDDDAVLLYAVDRLRGPEVKKQDFALCGEITVDGDKTFIAPVSKVPMFPDLRDAWRLEIANADSVRAAAGRPVAFEEWSIESDSVDDRARVAKFRPLWSEGDRRAGPDSDHIIFGDVQNPGWNEGFLVKIYGGGDFVAANNSGKCLSHGTLDQLGTDFKSVRKRLLGSGLMEIPKEPLTLNAAHFRTRFIGVATGGVSELRSDAEDIEALMRGAPAKKREAFSRIFDGEEQFINSLLRAP